MTKETNDSAVWIRSCRTSSTEYKDPKTQYTYKVTNYTAFSGNQLRSCRVVFTNGEFVDFVRMVMHENSTQEQLVIDFKKFTDGFKFAIQSLHWSDCVVTFLSNDLAWAKDIASSINLFAPIKEEMVEVELVEEQARGNSTVADYHDLQFMRIIRESAIVSTDTKDFVNRLNNMFS